MNAKLEVARPVHPQAEGWQPGSARIECLTCFVSRGFTARAKSCGAKAWAEWP